jgi:hypothetical protein
MSFVLKWDLELESHVGFLRQISFKSKKQARMLWIKECQICSHLIGVNSAEHPHHLPQPAIW